jgi:hypothetical protein
MIRKYGLDLSGTEHEIVLGSYEHENEFLTSGKCQEILGYLAIRINEECIYFEVSSLFDWFTFNTLIFKMYAVDASRYTETASLLEETRFCGQKLEAGVTLAMLTEPSA